MLQGKQSRSPGLLKLAKQRYHDWLRKCFDSVIPLKRRRIILEIVMQRKNERLPALDEACDP